VITISEFVVIGILEVFAILMLAVCALLIYNHKLHKRGKSLSTQLHQLKDTTQFLLKKVNEFSESTYASFLGREVEAARGQVSEFIVNNELHFLNDQCADDKAKIMRFLLLQAELEAEEATDDAEKRRLRAGKLADIVSDFEKSAAPSESAAIATQTEEIDAADLKQKWGYLVDAVLSLVRQRSFQAEDDLIDIVQVINQDLDMGSLETPDRDEFKSANSGTIERVREDADRSREVISKLLAERSAAEEQISIKASELEKLERFLKESEVCLSLVESELNEAHKALGSYKNVDEHDPVEMQNLIKRFSQESSEMLMCIETLEKENSDLKSQLGLN
jgi:uncharacterized cupredoxin-like copper-binding protein